MELGIQKYNGFFPTRCATNGSASAAMLALVVSCSYFLYFDVVYFFYIVFYLGLISPPIDLKLVRTFHIRKVHSLLRNQGPNYYMIVVHFRIAYIVLPLMFGAGLYSKKIKAPP